MLHIHGDVFNFYLLRVIVSNEESQLCLSMYLYAGM
jgi:hypothetical protein